MSTEDEPGDRSCLSLPTGQIGLGSARAGGSALWRNAPTRERADRLVGMLADYSYVSLHYYASERTESIRQDPPDSSGGA